MHPDHPTRRALFQTAGLGLGAAALAAEVAPAKVLAATAALTPAAGTFWTHEYWAHNGQAALYLYRKRRSAPVPGETPLPVLLLVHGSSVSSRPTFDLSVPGAGEYSLMQVFARLGYDVWTMDFAGYGRSDSAGNSDIAGGVSDLKAATALILRETGQKRLHFFGESSGALRAAAFAMAQPEIIGRLVFSAFTYTGKGSPTLADRAKQVEFYRTHSRRPRDLGMIRSIFTRDKPGTSDPRVAEAVAAAELPFGNSVPTGTYLDMTTRLPVIDPTKVLAPVLLVRGEYDGIATEEDILDFLHRLPNQDRQYAVIPGVAHSLVWGINRRGLWHVMHAFLTMPATSEA